MHLISLLLFSIFLAGCSDDEMILEKPEKVIERNQPIRIDYGTDPYQFGELRIPEGDSLFPVIMIIHGGCWQSAYDKTLMDDMADDLTRRGYATWNLEYRRLGNPGGGWPGTFLDIASGLKMLREIRNDYPLNLTKILVTGHSAGGHLALWLGGQSQLPDSAEIKTTGLPDIKGIVSLAGITDLESYLAPSGCGSSVRSLTGGEPNEYPERYAQGSPMTFIPLGVPRVLVNGENDGIVPVSHIRPYYEASVAANEQIELVTIPGAGHFEVISPGSIAWDPIVSAFEKLLNL